MKGLELSRALFEEQAKEELRARFPELFGRLACGLVGNGSECFGYDDELSRDHDWGADFYIWLPDDLENRAEELNTWKKAVLARCAEYPVRKPSRYGAVISVMTVSDFYRRLVGFSQGPRTAREWMSVPEKLLALTVNGEVFMDNDGAFTAVRERLRRHYPEDVLLKRLTARCMMLAQTGQYNLHRCHDRGDVVAAQTTLLRFTEEAIRMVHLLNGRYTPYYKWAYRSMRELPVLGGVIGNRLEALAVTCPGAPADEQKREATSEEICVLFADELRHRGLTSTADPFLAAHAEQLYDCIRDPFLRSLPLQVG